jgi:hypothetical protein
MTNRTIIATTFLLGVACDKPEQKTEDSPAPAEANAEGAADNRVDLDSVIHVVAEGKVTTAAELEAELESDAIARVDIDADGKIDKLKIVERRAEKTTVFEIRALPSSKAEVTLDAAPAVAQLELEARADAGDIVARASHAASFSASATVEHTFSAVASVSAAGTMSVDASANAFVSWAFQPARPVYVAQVFVIAEAEPPKEDPCWPPGHCKHGLWKATGEKPPGHEKRADASHAKGHHDDGHGKSGAKDKGPTHASADHGKPGKPASKSSDAPKPSASKGGGDKPDKSGKSNDKAKATGGKGKPGKS